MRWTSRAAALGASAGGFVAHGLHPAATPLRGFDHGLTALMEKGLAPPRVPPLLRPPAVVLWGTAGLALHALAIVTKFLRRIAE